MRFVNRIKDTWRQIFEEITVFEYVLWWVARIMLLFAVIFAESNAYRLLDSINMLAAYAMPLLRFIVPRKSFFARLHFRCQHIINIMEILGTFFGHLLHAYNYIGKYDRVLHLLSGPLVVIAGYYIIKALEEKDGKVKYLRPSTATVFSVSFSFLVMVCWEIQEFVSDFFLGSQNQSYYYGPGENDIWFRIFGQGAAGGEGQFPLWDTMMDLIDATLTTAIAGIVMYFVLSAIKKKAEKGENSCEEQNIPEKISV